MSALPCSDAFASLVVRIRPRVALKAGTTRVGCAEPVAEMYANVSSIDCVEKLQDRITDAGSTPIACAMLSCGFVNWQTCCEVASLIVLQSAGADLMLAYRVSEPIAWPVAALMPSVRITM
jgi:hypothetical protein